MNVRQCLLGAIAGALFPTAALAEDWWLTSAGGNQIHFADVSTLVERDDHRRIWFRWEYTKPDRGILTRLMILAKVNCDDQSVILEQQLGYDTSNKKFLQEPARGQPEYPPPGSLGMADLQFVCAYSAAEAADGRVGKAAKLRAGLKPGDIGAAERRK